MNESGVRLASYIFVVRAMIMNIIEIINVGVHCPSDHMHSASFPTQGNMAIECSISHLKKESLIFQTMALIKWFG